MSFAVGLAVAKVQGFAAAEPLFALLVAIAKILLFHMLMIYQFLICFVAHAELAINGTPIFSVMCVRINDFTNYAMYHTLERGICINI